MAKARHGLYSSTTGKLAETDLLGGSSSRRADVRVRSGIRTRRNTSPDQFTNQEKFKTAQQIVASGSLDTLWKAFYPSITSRKRVCSATAWMLSALYHDQTKGWMTDFTDHLPRLGPRGGTPSWRSWFGQPGCIRFGIGVDNPSANFLPSDQVFVLLVPEVLSAGPVRWTMEYTREDLMGTIVPLCGMPSNIVYTVLGWFGGKDQTEKMQYSQVYRSSARTK